MSNKNINILKNENNKLGKSAIVLFIVGIIIILLGFMDGQAAEDIDSGGWIIVFSIIFACFPIGISGTLSLINIIKHHSKKNNYTCNKILLVFNWILLFVSFIPLLIAIWFLLLQTVGRLFY